MFIHLTFKSSIQKEISRASCTDRKKFAKKMEATNIEWNASLNAKNEVSKKKQIVKLNNFYRRAIKCNAPDSNVEQIKTGIFAS